MEMLISCLKIIGVEFMADSDWSRESPLITNKDVGENGLSQDNGVAGKGEGRQDEEVF